MIFNLPHRTRLKLAGHVKSKQIKAILQMPEPNLQPFLERQINDLQKKGASLSTALAYQSIAPLMLENRQILEFLEIPENFDLQPALPDIKTTDEALLLGQKEYQLLPPEVEQLEQLLNRLVTG